MDRIFNQEITATMAKVWMEMIDAVLSLAEKDNNAEKMLLFLDKKMPKGMNFSYYLNFRRTFITCINLLILYATRHPISC